MFRFHMQNIKDIEGLFYKGQFKKVAAAFPRKISGKAIHFRIGALCMLGQGEDAELLLKDSQLKRNEIIFCHFWLGVFHARKGSYKAARKYFGSNLRQRKNKLSKEERFYLFQGLGFYRFLLHKPNRALFYAQKAWGLGFVSDKPFMQILALDLRGQSLIQMHEVEQGLLQLRRAKNIADKIDDHGLSTALSVSIYTLGSKNQKNSISDLLKFRSQLETEDSYSADLLNLEIAERYFLNGKADLGEKFLIEAKDQIFAKANTRHKKLWQKQNEILAWLRREKNNHQELLPAVFSKELSQLVSVNFQDVLLKKFFIEKEILSAFLPLISEKKMQLIIDIMPNSILIYEHGNFYYHKDVLTSQLRGLLLLIFSGPQNQEDIIKKLYGYNYEAYRHDPMVYSLIHRLRSIISPFENWLEFKNKKYQINEDVSILFFEQLGTFEKPGQEKIPELPTIYKNKEHQLNYRQLWALHFAIQHGYVRSQDLTRNHKVTAMTAFRDLQQLVQQKIMRKKGNGRSTHYCPIQKPFS